MFRYDAKECQDRLIFDAGNVVVLQVEKAKARRPLPNFLFRSLTTCREQLAAEEFLLAKMTLIYG